jgi:hypothetical protein
LVQRAAANRNKLLDSDYDDDLTLSAINLDGGSHHSLAMIFTPFVQIYSKLSTSHAFA